MIQFLAAPISRRGMANAVQTNKVKAHTRNVMKEAHIVGIIG